MGNAKEQKQAMKDAQLVAIEAAKRAERQKQQYARAKQRRRDDEVH